MKSVGVVREIPGLLLEILGWTILVFIGMYFLTNGRILASLDQALYFFLTILSYFGALLTAIFTIRRFGKLRNRLLVMGLGIVVFLAMFFVIQSVSALIFEVIIGPMDGSVEINHINFDHI